MHGSQPCFVLFFLAPAGIDVQCVLPMFVTSKLSKIRKASAFVPNPDTFARSAVCASFVACFPALMSTSIHDRYCSL